MTSAENIFYVLPDFQELWIRPTAKYGTGQNRSSVIYL